MLRLQYYESWSHVKIPGSKLKVFFILNEDITSSTDLAKKSFVFSF
jgi:hypothetical protein